MAQTGYTPISIYYSSTTTNVPTAGNLVAGELAINTADGKLFYKDSSGVVQTLATKSATSGTFTTITNSGLTSGRVVFSSTGGLEADSANLFWDIANSRLGIGTTTPYFPLQVTGTIKVATGNAQGILGLGDGAGNSINCGVWRGANNNPYADGNYLNLGGYDAISFAVGNAAIGSQTQRMIIDSAGTTSISTTASNGLNVTSTNSFSAGNANYVIFYMSNMTGGTNGIALGKSSSTYNTSKIVFGYAGSGSSSNYLGLGFYDADNRLVIYPTGNASLTGSLTQNTSDDRLKTNFETISNALDKVCSLRGFTHNWNDLAVKLNNSDPSIKESGVSAQEVQKVLPEAVCIAPFDQVKGNRFESESGENYLTVQYEKLVPLLIESIKELNAKVTALETQLGAK